MKTLGILGGMGPEASARFYTMLTAMTAAARDQDHIDILLHSLPSIPDRTAHLTGRGTSPIPRLIEGLQGLERAGAELLVIPCVTSHSFYAELAGAVRVPLLNMVALTAQELRRRGVNAAGILATDGTIRADLFGKALAEQGITAMYPDEIDQSVIMSIIFDQLKAHGIPDKTAFCGVTERLRLRGAELCVLGCTELPLIGGLDDGYADPMELLARRALTECGAMLTP